MKIKPRNNLVLIEPYDEITLREKETGILLPEHDMVMPQKGKVIAIGDKVKEIKVGETIVFDRIRVDNFKDRVGLIDKKYLLVPENLIFAILE